MYSAKLERKAVDPLSCHGLKFLAQTMEGNNTQPDTNSGGAMKNLKKERKKVINDSNPRVWVSPSKFIVHFYHYYIN